MPNPHPITVQEPWIVDDEAFAEAAAGLVDRIANTQHSIAIDQDALKTLIQGLVYVSFQEFMNIASAGSASSGIPIGDMIAKMLGEEEEGGLSREEVNISAQRLEAIFRLNLAKEVFSRKNRDGLQDVLTRLRNQSQDETNA